LVLDQDTALVFSIADTGDSPPADDEDETGEEAEENDNEAEEEEEEGDDEDAEPEPVDLTIEVVTADGGVASIALSSVRRLVPPLPSRFSKLPTEGWAWGRAWETTLQTVEVPLSRFSEELPELDPSAITQISFVFDKSPEGMVLIDDIGFSQP
jgi:hypothetical protein